MLRQLIRSCCLPALLAACVLSAGENPDEQLILLEEGRAYRTVNGEVLSGKDVLDLLIEESWERDLQVFIEHALIAEEVAKAKIVVADEEVETELKRILEEYAKRFGLDIRTLVPDKVLRHAGLPGSLQSIRRHIKDNIGLLKLLQRDKKVPAKIAVMSKEFQAAVQEFIQELVTAKGIVRDRTKLGPGEAVRIAGRGYSRDEVRAFIADGLRQIPMGELLQKLDVLSLEKLVNKMLAEKKIELAKSDLDFHHDFLCKLLEAQHNIPGKIAMQQQLQRVQMTREQFQDSRPFRIDAALTRLAKDPIKFKHIKEEFAANPGRYKRSESLIAHIFVQVRDPSGVPYTADWQAPGHGAVNAYAAKRRDEAFEAARTKVEGLVPLAKADFAGAAKKYSDDKGSTSKSGTAEIGGTIGRVGAETILVPPCDANVRDAAVKLKPGEISAPVRSDYGWHIIKCLDQQDVTVDEAAPRIYMNLIHDAKRKLHDELLKSAKIVDKN